LVPGNRFNNGLTDWHTTITCKTIQGLDIYLRSIAVREVLTNIGQVAKALLSNLIASNKNNTCVTNEYAILNYYLIYIIF